MDKSVNVSDSSSGGGTSNVDTDVSVSSAAPVGTQLAEYT